MADSFTTKLNLTKPEVGASTDTWGEKLNANFDILDDALLGSAANTIESTDAGAAAGPVFELYRNSASPAALDALGQWKFTGKDSAGNPTLYAAITAFAESPTSGSEVGFLHFSVARNGDAVTNGDEGFIVGAYTSGGVLVNAAYVRNYNSAGAGDGLVMGLARGTYESPAIVQSGDALGYLSFQGFDGNEFEYSAWIEAKVDGTPGSNDMPTRLGFYTAPDGSKTPQERFRISADGTASFYNAIQEKVFTITDGAAFEIDPRNGTVQLITLGASRTPKATNFAAGEAITLMVDDGTAYTITWTDATFGGSGVVWETNGGVAPTLATSGYTTIVLWKVGTQIYGARVGDT
jgi:hypothetical protein